ncbi:Hint domain-containing protein [Roseovarius sp. CH_XMU1461]|uniref:Hint domain-containing protein n=1 Tax=Roseovarius sp. CH_XMU1461 TaxID=3107777 RepID=UPI00300B95E8
MVYSPSAPRIVAPRTTHPASNRPASRPQDIRPTAQRVYDVSWLNRHDGSVQRSRVEAPAGPIFEAAFSAFARGTLITTTQGPVAVEDLVPGMLIQTRERGPSPLLWIGSMQLAPDNIAPVAPLTRVMTDAFGLGRPSPDFLAGPGARLLQRTTGGPGDNSLRSVQSFADGHSVIPLRPPSPVRLYHLALQRHATITAAGLTTESFHPGAGFNSIVSYETSVRFMALFPHLRKTSEFGSLAHPRQPLPMPIE